MKTWAKRANSKSGFTIVELVIVITVIGILASITIVAYSGIQERARDSGRLVDAKMITNALGSYKLKYGEYPNEQGSGWERSTNYPDSFINDLVTSGATSTVSVDPLNSDGYEYRYYRYPAGSGGCDSAKGEFFVLEIKQGEQSAVSDSSPGFTCYDPVTNTGRNWTTEGWWVTGGYTIR